MSKIDAGLVVPIPILPVACWRTNCEVPNVSPPANVLVLVLVTARLVMVVVPAATLVSCARPETYKAVVVALVVVAFVATKVVAVKSEIVARVEVRVSMTPVVKRPRTEKRFVEVALVVDA